ncbi:tetratricopeptide repeat protein [Gemmatimonadota bacterium]
MAAGATFLPTVPSVPAASSIPSSRRFPLSPFLHEKLGAAYEMKDDPQKALESYENALRLNPENKALEEKIERLRR